MAELSKKEFYLQKKQQDDLTKQQYKNLDLAKEIQQILSTNSKKSYIKNFMDGPQRIQLTILAEQNNLATYYTISDNINYLTIDKSKQENIDPTQLSESQIASFSEIVNMPLDTSQHLKDITLFNLQPQFNTFIASLQKYGNAGYKRREEIVHDYIISTIKSNPNYVKFLQQDQHLLGDISKPFTIMKTVYTPDNNNKIFWSVDIKASIFLAYHQLDIIKESSWNDYISTFTKDLNIINNKKFRSRIFGKLDSNKKNTILINNTIIPVWDILKPYFEKQLVAMEGDEVVLLCNNMQQELEIIKSLKLPDYINLNCYRLVLTNVNNPENTYYVRHFLHPENKKPDIKCAKQSYIRDAYVRLYEDVINKK